MNYDTLTQVQKRCVDAYIEQRPSLSLVDTINRKDVEAIFFELHAARATGGAKIGFPSWLVKTKELQVGRGLYRFPRPGADMAAPGHVVKKEVAKAVPVDTSDEDREFFKDLADFGVEIV